MLKQSAFLQAVEKTCVLLAHQSRYEFVTPEILLYYGILGLDQFEKLCSNATWITINCHKT